VPQLETGDDGVPFDTHQKVREDFYEALTAFGMCLKVALASRSFYEDGSVGEGQITAYKRDLKFFTSLRQMAKQDAQETVDFSAYEQQIRKLVDRYVLGEDIVASDDIFLVNELGQESNPETWSDEKTRNETDIIKSRLRKTIEQELIDDPFAARYFSDLLKQAIAEAQAMFDHPGKQYALFKELDERVAARSVDGVPEQIAANRPAAAYFGLFRLVLSDDEVLGTRASTFEKLAIAIERIVNDAVAENSLNPHNIEAAIRKGLLPLLFGEIGLDHAKAIADKVVEVVRVGLSRGTL
jgi:type I restriction enzyme R subunit